MNDWTDDEREPGRATPHDAEAERGVLGAMLLSKHAIDDVMELLDPADFYVPAHEAIFLAVLQLHADGGRPDAVTVGHELERRGELKRIGGAPYLHTLMGSVVVAASAGYYAQIVRAHAVRRRMIEAGTRIAAMGYATDDPADLAEIVDRAQAEANALGEHGGHAEEPTNAEVFDGLLDKIEKGVPLGVATGFRDLDELTGGLQPGQMIIIAARPSLGKSTLGLDFLRKISIGNRVPSGMFSLEMNREELIRRGLSAEGGINLHHLAPGRMTEDDWARAARVRERIVTAPVWIDDAADLTMMRIRTKARRMVQKHGVRLIVIDYAQLMSSGSTRRHENRQTEVSEISRGSKLLAKELDIPVVLIAQLNRGPEQRADKRPMASDLRESGSLEQDADVIILIHREDAYERESPRAGEADLIVAKHRNGPTATITVAFQGHYARFVDMAQS